MSFCVFSVRPVTAFEIVAVSFSSPSALQIETLYEPSSFATVLIITESFLSSVRERPDTALKISKVLNLDLEYLITGKPRSKSTQNDILDEEIQQFLKYRSFVKKLDLLDETTRNAVLEMIRNLPPEK